MLPGLHSLQLRVTTAPPFVMAGVGQRRARSPTRVFFVPPSRHLLCSLCDEHFNAVVLPCAGGHTFCRACVLRWFARQRTCPECRAAIPANATLVPSRLVKAMVDELRVRCRFGVKEEGDGWVADEEGCPAQLSLDGAAAHEATCGFATTTCPFAGCGVELGRNQTDAHDAAFALAHARGEQAARLAGAAASASRFAAMEARLSEVENRHRAGWVLRKTIKIADEDEGDDDDEGPIIWCCAFSPNSSSVCVGLQTGSLKLFDVASSDLRLTLEGHEHRVFCCAFSPNGAMIVSASHDKTLKLWNAASGALIRTLCGHMRRVWSCAFSPDGRSICSGSSDKSLKIWDAGTGVCQHTLRGHTSFVPCCAYSADGATVLSSGDHNTFKLWSVATGACIRIFNGHTEFVWSCCFSPADGNIVLSCSGDETLKLWDASTGECRRTLIGNTGPVRLLRCAFSPNGNVVLSCGRDLTTKLWDTTTGACTATLKGHKALVCCCAFSSDGAIIASGDIAGELKLWKRR